MKTCEIIVFISLARTKAICAISSAKVHYIVHLTFIQFVIIHSEIKEFCVLESILHSNNRIIERVSANSKFISTSSFLLRLYLIKKKNNFYIKS